MLYHLSANLVLIVHMAFVVFVVLGGLLVVRWPHLMWLDLAAVTWGALTEFVGIVCPLTLLEVALRQLGGEAGYASGFIDHYLTAVLYPSGLTREMQIWLGFAVLLPNVLIYGYRVRAPIARVTYSLYAWAVALGIGVPAVLRIALCREQARAWMLNHQAASAIVRALRIPFTVELATDVDLRALHVIIANHCSYVDSIFVAALLPYPHVVVVKAEFERVPVFRSYLRSMEAIFVDRAAPEKRSLELERMKAALARGLSVIIFPEGTFAAEAGLRRFHLGAFEIAVASGVPIIPITLQGTRSVLRDGSWLARRLPVRVIIGGPLTAPDGETPFAAAEQLRDEARALILRHCGEPDLLECA